MNVIREWAYTFGKEIDKEISDYTNEDIVILYGCKILGGNGKLYYFDDMWSIQPKIKDYVVVENRDDIALAKVVAYVEVPHNQADAISMTPISAMKRILGIFDKDRLYKCLELRNEKDLDDILEGKNE